MERKLPFPVPAFFRHRPFRGQSQTAEDLTLKQEYLHGPEADIQRDKTIEGHQRPGKQKKHLEKGDRKYTFSALAYPVSGTSVTGASLHITGKQ
jgi:hypothetical protein